MRAISLIGLLLFCASVQLANTEARDRGITAFHQGRYSEALTALQQATESGSDPVATVFLALTRAALGDCSGALPGLAAAHKNAAAPLSSMAGLAAAKCYAADGQELRAYGLLEELKRESPDNADVWYLSAKLHMKAFNDATFAMFQHTPASYRVHELSAEIFEIQNRFSDAITEYRKAIELNPAAPELHYRLGRALLLASHDEKSYAEAAEQFRGELKLSPEDAACEFQLGQIAQVQGDAAGAQSHFEQALKLSPNFAQAMVALGKLYSKDKHYDRAVTLLTRATELQPDNEAAHYALLTAYRNTGKMDQAKREKDILDRLQKPPEGEFTNFLKKLGEKQPAQ